MLLEFDLIYVIQRVCNSEEIKRLCSDYNLN